MSESRFIFLLSCCLLVVYWLATSKQLMRLMSPVTLFIRKLQSLIVNEFILCHTVSLCAFPIALKCSFVISPELYKKVLISCTLYQCNVFRFILWKTLNIHEPPVFAEVVPPPSRCWLLWFIMGQKPRHNGPKETDWIGSWVTFRNGDFSWVVWRYKGGGKKLRRRGICQ